MLRVRVQLEDFDPGVEMKLLRADDAGGIGSFIGTVRGKVTGTDEIIALHLEHYPAMTEPALHRIAEDAAARWPLRHCTIIHRFGRLALGENIVFVGASSAHRDAALSATLFLIDWLKTSAPFWKREEFASGKTVWVEARAADDEAAAAWISKA